MCPELFESRNSEGFTPAGLACKLGKLRIIQWILVNVQPHLLSKIQNSDKEETNILEISTIFDQSECLLWLFSELERKGLPLGFRNSAGDSLLHIAARHNSLHCSQAWAEKNSSNVIFEENFQI